MAHLQLVITVLLVTVATTFATPVRIGALSTLFHQVSGTVFAIDNRTFEIQNMVYDGLGPATFFVAGNGPVSSNNFRLRVLPACSGNILPAFKGDNVRMGLPAGKTLADVDFISVWRESFAVSFGDVVVNPAEKALVIPETSGSVCPN